MNCLNLVVRLADASCLERRSYATTYIANYHLNSIIVIRWLPVIGLRIHLGHYLRV